MQHSRELERFLIMKAHCNLVALLMLQAFALLHAAEPEQLRPVITKGLGFLAKAGEQWMEDKNCNGCHHLPEMIWTHREATLRGFAVDRKKYDEWLDWASSRVKDISPGLDQAAFMMLALPQSAPPDAGKVILANQKKDGTWKPGTQFTGMQRRDSAEATFHSARLFLLALASTETGRKTAEETAVRVAALKGFNDPPKSVETLAFRTLYSRRFGTPDETAVLLAELLKQQRDDGGWSWMIGDPQSDALATGEALFVLHHFDDPKVKEAVARAQQRLLDTQAGDGSWPVQVTMFSKNPRNEPGKEKSLKEATGIYTYWASSWATLGLLQGMPAKDMAVKQD